MKVAGLGILLLALIGVFWPWSEDATTDEITQEEEVALTLGDSTVVVAVFQQDGSLFSMLVLHDDENTAVDAGKAFVDQHGGRLVELRAQGERRVRFSIGGKDYDFDPNRVFTDAGIRATLEPQSDEAAFSTTRTFAEGLLAVYEPNEIIVTLHNNTPGNYSALSYADGGQFSSDAQAVHVEAGVDPDDFLFVTDADLFDALRADDFNVVLQDNSNVTDDGSLSVWAAQNGFLYVNVEAEHGHLEQQKAMIEGLEFLLRMLDHRHHAH